MSGSKKTINMLMNIDNYLGEHEGRLVPIILFLAISAAPFLLYAVMLQGVIPFKFMILFEVVWTARVGLYILGDENNKLEQYKLKRQNVYATADQIIRVSNINEDGLIEYSNGRIAYIISGYLLDYIDEESLSIDFQAFLQQLRGYEYDILNHMVVDEYRLQNNCSGISTYKDAQVLRERMIFYQAQDEYCAKNSEAFRISFLIKGSKYDWKNMKTKLEELVGSEFAYCWKEITVCDREQVCDIMSRDLCLDVDIYGMLVYKYKNEEYYGSEVLFYGDNVPEKYKVKRDRSSLQKRRVVMRNYYDK